MTKFASPAFLALCLTIAVWADRPQVQPPEPPGNSESASPFQISVDLNLVVLPATVRTHKGEFATNLREENFQVYEDGVRQAIRLFRHEDIPVTAGLVVDHSGSMQSKIANVLAAAQAFVSQSNPQDQIFVINFNERVTSGLPETTPFTNRVDEMEAAIMNAPVSGETALYDAIDSALKHLRTGDSQKKILIVISDGGDNASILTLPQILKEAGESGAILYTIGIFDANDPDRDAGVLRRLAKETGGEAFFPSRYADAIAICREIARDIRHQYTLGYVSTNTQTVGRRAIRVVARDGRKDLVVRTRTGYIAAATSGAKDARDATAKDAKKQAAP